MKTGITVYSTQRVNNQQIDVYKEVYTRVETFNLPVVCP